jgi:2-iminoacetate synthase ThiH
VLPAVTGYPKLGIHDMVTILFVKYDKELDIVREVVSITDILSKCGGFASFIIFVSIMFAHTFQNSIY